jgi:hypothetical protein
MLAKINITYYRSAKLNELTDYELLTAIYFISLISYVDYVPLVILYNNRSPWHSRLSELSKTEQEVIDKRLREEDANRYHRKNMMMSNHIPF